MDRRDRWPWKRLAVRAGPPAACLLVGAVLLLAGDDLAVISAGLIGVAVVLAISNGFYEIGRSEDRARARDAARRRRR